jgi:hypothetical protein
LQIRVLPRRTRRVKRICNGPDGARPAPRA